MMRLISAAALAWSLTLVGTAHAVFPDKPIRYVVHVSPGGATDVMARKLANILQRDLGQPVVVDNRPGGRGAAQLADLRVAKPDGYTIATVTNTHVGAFHQTLKQYNIDSVDWIAKLVEEPYLFAVGSNAPYKSMPELMRAIKAAPGKTVIAGFTRGSGLHTAWEMLLKAAGVPGTAANWVPYDSNGDAVTAVLGGHGVGVMAYVDLVKAHVEAGSLRVIGVMSDRRLPQFPDVPTFTEQGLDVASDWQQWRGVIGPKGMPDDVKEKLAAAIAKAMQAPEMKEYLDAGSLQLSVSGPKDFTSFARDQDRVTVEWLKTLGLLR